MNPKTSVENLTQRCRERRVRRGKSKDRGFQMEKQSWRSERKEEILHPIGESNIVRKTVVNPQNLRVSAPLREIKTTLFGKGNRGNENVA